MYYTFISLVFIMVGPQYDRNFGGYRVFCGDLGMLHHVFWNLMSSRRMIRWTLFSGSRTNKFDLEKEFDSFGPLVDCWVARNPPGFAFIVYKHADDAERAVEELDGRWVMVFCWKVFHLFSIRMICGRRVRVEHARPTVNKKGATFGRGYLRQRSPGYRWVDQ